MGTQGGHHVAICGPTGPTSFSIGASSTLYIASHGEALVLEGWHRDAEEARVVVGDYQAAVSTPATKSARISPGASFAPLALATAQAPRRPGRTDCGAAGARVLPA